MDNKLEIELELLQEVIDYLQKQPYHNVHQLIHKIVVATRNDKEE
jgi:hypothetical protein